jgi:hypothetical protein
MATGTRSGRHRRRTGRDQPGITAPERLGQAQPAPADQYASHAEGNFPTPSGKVEFCSSIAEQAQLDKGTRRCSTPLDEHLARPGAEIPDVSWPGGGLPMPPGNAPHGHWRDYAVRRGWTRMRRAV